MNIRRNNKGFTIVELLIVVVVIAILAAITIVAYNGITSRTRQSIMQNNINQVAKLVTNHKTINGAYPASLSVLNGGAGPGTGAEAQYAYTLSGEDYFLTVGSLNSTDKYRISNTIGKVESGFWPGHDSILASNGYPTRGGYTDITSSYGSGDTIAAPIGSIATGSWMIVILSYNQNADPVAPAGWTALVTRKSTNTMQTSIYAKIKQAGDAANQEFDPPGASGRDMTNALLLWGNNSAAVGSWTLGGFGDRSVNATATTAVTPTVSVTTPKSLVISIATERTSATESNYTSLTGATAWAWVPQVDPANKIQTITVGYNEQATAGTSQAMTVTYPNSQVTNATAIQIVIPPAI